MGMSKGPESFKSAIVRRTTLAHKEALYDPHRATYVPAKITIEKSGKTTFQPSIEVRQKPYWLYSLDLSWNEQLGPMMTAMGMELPNTAAEHDEGAMAVAAELRRWGRNNLKGQIGVDVRPGFVAELKVYFEKKSDLVKFKLAWWNL